MLYSAQIPPTLRVQNKYVKGCAVMNATVRSIEPRIEPQQQELVSGKRRRRWTRRELGLYACLPHNNKKISCSQNISHPKITAVHNDKRLPASYISRASVLRTVAVNTMHACNEKRYEPRFYWFGSVGMSTFLLYLLIYVFIFDHSKIGNLGQMQVGTGSDRFTTV